MSSELAAFLRCEIADCIQTKTETNLQISYLKSKAIPVQSYVGSQRFRLPGCSENWHIKVVRLSALCANRLHSQRRSLVLISVTG